MPREVAMSLFVVFTLGYLIGGVSALVLLGLTIASREGDRVRRDRW